MADLKESSLFRSLEEQRKHWYYLYKTEVVRNLLSVHLPTIATEKLSTLNGEIRPLRCMDIGAGNGIISRSLGTSIRQREAVWDLVDSAYSPNELGPDPRDPSFVLTDSIPDFAQYDLIIAIDVVEHIKNDIQFVEEMVSHLARGGLIVICVPAFQFIWSSHDVFLEHYRRYRRKDLVSLMQRAGLRVMDSCYLYVLIFPVIVFIRLLGNLQVARLNSQQESMRSQLKVYPKIVNCLLRGVMRTELLLLRLFPRLTKIFGVSCAAIGAQALESRPDASSITSLRI
jgi:SAM-dependent methyltransferase